LTKKAPRTRAITEASKNQRTESLISAARELFETKDFDDISTADIAHRAGLAKGTLFLYFKTKESLFLEVLSLSMREWFAESAILIRKKRKSPQVLAKVIATTLVARPALVRLLALLHPVLERNSDLDSLSRFKHSLLVLTNESASLFQVILGLPSQTCVRTVLWMHALIVGLAQITTPPTQVRIALEKTDLAVIWRDLEAEFEAALNALFEGVSRRKPRGKRHQ